MTYTKIGGQEYMKTTSDNEYKSFDNFT